MGNFYVNFTTRGPGHDAIVRSLQAAERNAYVGPTRDGWTLFFEEKSDTQDDIEIRLVGERVSLDTAAPVLAVLNHDDDILAYWLFQGGELVDEYNSSPGYFTGEEDSPSGGDAKRLCDAFGAPTKVDDVNVVLHDTDYGFAMERHGALAALLGLPWEDVYLGYDYIQEGAVEGDLDMDSMEHVVGLADDDEDEEEDDDES